MKQVHLAVIYRYFKRWGENWKLCETVRFAGFGKKCIHVYSLVPLDDFFQIFSTEQNFSGFSIKTAVESSIKVTRHEVWNFL